VNRSELWLGCRFRVNSVDLKSETCLSLHFSSQGLRDMERVWERRIRCNTLHLLFAWTSIFNRLDFPNGSIQFFIDFLCLNAFFDLLLLIYFWPLFKLSLVPFCKGWK
jgi:hypothetical protein